PSIGTFNNLNPYVDKGLLARFISPRSGSAGSIILDPLMRKCEDELAAYYVWLAESVEVADDYSWVTYKLRENAYWHDGRPVTIEDILWTFDMIKTKGSPMWKSLYHDIVRLEQVDEWSFTFHFSETAEKTPQLVIETATFAPAPKHYWETRAIDETTLEPPLGNGAYRIAAVDPGYKVVYERVEDYWGRDLNFAAGHFNFDAVEIIWFFDKRVMLQALRAGAFDYWFEENESDFAT
ncbi:MAG: ABC transporter substrate-binding protein, partial [Gammaproteobacteria bacterium]|nr:ABC transporter substrate-binding protein [Gammaproteobacteria bacterium]